MDSKVIPMVKYVKQIEEKKDIPTTTMKVPFTFRKRRKKRNAQKHQQQRITSFNQIAIQTRNSKKQTKLKVKQNESKNENRKRNYSEIQTIDNTNNSQTNFEQMKTRRKLSKNTKIKNNNFNTFSSIPKIRKTDIIGNEIYLTSSAMISDRNILSNEKPGQGAVVEVFVDSKTDTKSNEHAINTTSNNPVLYHGLKAQQNVSNIRPKKRAPKFLGIGPQRAPDNVRINCRFDYQPDICKDWKETGYCGYGQSCKFLHDRSDYKSGWELDRDWDAAQLKKQQLLKGELVDDDDADKNWEIHSSDEDGDCDDKYGLPFACFICRKNFIHPIVTQCKHYFCEKCAMERYAKSPGCAACGKDTEGIFQTAERLIQKIKNARNIV